MSKTPNFTNFDLAREILEKTDEEIKKMPPVNILVAGKTGVGKSTLINALFREKLATTGIGQPVTQHIEKIQKEGLPISLYDTRGLELNPQVQKQVLEEIHQLYEDNLGSLDQIHLCYYCINANSNRIEEAEVDLIKSMSEKMPIILVLTQSIGEPAQVFKDHLMQMGLPLEDIINVMAKDYRISDDLVIESFGLKTLIQRSLDILPDDLEGAFNNAQHADIARKAASARKWAKGYITAAFGVGFIPIPFSDASLLVPMQMTLIAHITAIFGVSLDKSSILSLIAAVFGSTGARSAGRYLSSNLLKLLPGAGTLAGGAISGVTASLITSALAMAYIEVLSMITKAEKASKLDEIPDLEYLMKIKYKDYLRKGKTLTDTDPEKESHADLEEGIASESEKSLSWWDRLRHRRK